jgi:hypothetical protein
MADIAHDAHVEEERLALLYTDLLDLTASDRILCHLQGCEGCQAEATKVVETVAALALLSGAGYDDTPAVQWSA